MPLTFDPNLLTKKKQKLRFDESVLSTPESLPADWMEPSEEDKAQYRKWGIEEYRSPSGKLYDLTTQTPEFPAPPGNLRGALEGEQLSGKLRDIAKRKGIAHKKFDPIAAAIIRGTERVYEDIGIVSQMAQEMGSPTTQYTRDETEAAAKELPKRLLWYVKSISTLGGRIPPVVSPLALMVYDIENAKGMLRGEIKPTDVLKRQRLELAKEAEHFAGFGSATMPLASETGTLAIEWGFLYPALFKLAGLTNTAITSMPKVQKGLAAIKRAGGLEKVAAKFPRLYNSTAKILGAFTKGAQVGTVMGLAETVGGEPLEEVLKTTTKRAALMGGVAVAFQSLSQIDTALYIRDFRANLLKASNQRFSAEIANIKSMIPKGPQQTSAIKGLQSAKTRELKAIDSIVSGAEAQLRGIKEGKLYQQGQEAVETPQQAAKRFIARGFKSQRPFGAGEPALKKGLGKTEPFIKMPTTKVGEVREAVGEAAKAIRHPVRAVQRAVRPTTQEARMPPKSVTPPPVDLTTRQAAEVEQMDRELAAIQAPQEVVRAPQAPPTAKKPAEPTPYPEMSPKDRRRQLVRDAKAAEAEAAAEGKVETPKMIEPAEAFETRDYKSVGEFKDKGEFLDYIKPQLKETSHPHVPGAKTVRPYVVGYGCDGSTDANIHYVAQKMCKLLGLEYAEIYRKAYPGERGSGWIEEDLSVFKDESLKTKPVKETTIIPKNATVQDVLDDLYDINNRSVVTELEEALDKLGVEPQTKLSELKPPAPQAPAVAKQPWEMTSEEFIKDWSEKATKGIQAKEPDRIYRVLKGDAELKASRFHKEYVQDAVKQGKPIPRAVLEGYKSQKWAQEALAKPKPKVTEGEITEEEMTGMSRKRRLTLIRQTRKRIREHPAYKEFDTAFEDNLQALLGNVGAIYVEPTLWADLEDVIGTDRRTKLARIFTKDKGPSQGWDEVTEYIADELGNEEARTWDIYTLVQHIKDAIETTGKKGAFKPAVIAEIESDPDAQLLIMKEEMLNAGYTVNEIDDAIADWIEHYDPDGTAGLEETVFDEFIGPEAKKLRDIKKMKGEEQERALEALARDNVLRRERTEGLQAAKEVLKANDIEVPVKEVAEITEDDIPFERVEGRPTGATVTLGEKQIVLLAYGADSETGYHEGYHILRSRLTNKDLKFLKNKFKDEEAEAREFARYVKTGKTTPLLRTIWRKLLNILREIKSALQGRGYRTVEDIFGEIRAGTVEKVAARPGVAFERGVFDQPIQKQLWLPLAQRQANIRKIQAREKYAQAKEVKAREVKAKAKDVKPYEHWGPMGRPPVKSALVKAVDAEITRTMKPRSNNVRITPEQMVSRLRKADLYYDPRNPLPEIKEAYTQLVKGGPLFKLETSTDRLRREAIRNAQMKAEKARLKKRITPKVSRAKLKLNIRDTTPMLSPELGKEPGTRRIPIGREVPIPKVSPKGTPKFLGMAEPDIPLAEQIPEAKTPTKILLPDKWFEENIKTFKKDKLAAMGSLAKGAYKGFDFLFEASSERLYKINPLLFRETRRYVYDVLTRSAEMTDQIEPFLKGYKKMSKTDRRTLDLALKNAYHSKIVEIVAKNNLEEEYDQAREVLDILYDATVEVGIDMEYKKDYWHRDLKDPKGFLEYFQKGDDWSIIEQAMRTRAERAGRKVEELTIEERAYLVNTLLRGFRTQGLTLSRPGAAKERVIDVIDRDLNQFYADSSDAIVKYIKLMNSKIAEREFFGKETKEITALRKLQSTRLSRLIKLGRKQGLKYGTEQKYTEHISKTRENYQAGRERLERITKKKPEDSIGGYVDDLWRTGQIKPSQEKELQGILKGIFYPKGMGRGMGLIATGIYVDTINSHFQALTQLDEFAYAMYRSPTKAIPVAIMTALRRSKIKPADIGIRSIGEEFREPSLHSYLSWQLKKIFFEQIDRLNKENLINTALWELQSKAKKNPAALNLRLKRVFGDEYQQVIEDLKKPIKSVEDASDNVRYLVFNEVLDFQPIAVTEMPEAYNKSGNLKILYALKTFYIKRFSAIRREAFRDMKHANTFARGFKALVMLSLWFALLGAASDSIKDFLKGKTFDLADSVIENTLRIFMSSKFQVTQAKKKGAGTAVLEQFVPPTKVYDAVSKDIVTLAEGKDRGFELWRSVPIVGEPYYWWFGRGKEKVEAAEGTKTPWE